MAKPISPGEVVELKKSNKLIIPDAVIEAWNECIARSLDGTVALIGQDDIVAAICAKLEISRPEVFKKGYLNIEDVYRAEGWFVEYDKPAYNETYSAFWRFSFLP